MDGKTEIRGLYFDPCTAENALAKIGEHLQNGRGFLKVFTVNAEIAQSCVTDENYRTLVNGADLLLADGDGVLAASRILRRPLPEKVAGVELGERLLAYAAKQHKKVFFLGGKPGVAVQAQARMEGKYPGLCVCGTENGYFSKDGEENQRIVNRIARAGTDLLFVCMGAPVQEQWITEFCQTQNTTGAAIALGGSIDVYAGNVKRAPRLFICARTEWLWRLMREPKRFFRMRKLPVYLLGTWRERFRR